MDRATILRIPAMNDQTTGKGRIAAVNALLDHLVTARVNLMLTRTLTYPAGAGISASMTPTTRLIQLEAGQVAYQLEGRAITLHAGDLLLVPAMCHRSWRTMGKESCRLSWVEFALHPAGHELPAALVSHGDDGLSSCFRNVFDLSQKPNGHAPLLAELGMKHLLAQLLTQNHWQDQAAPAHAGDPAAAAMVAILQKHLAAPDALDRLSREAASSAHRIRLKFRSALGMSPGRCLAMLRMRHARFLLLTTPLSVKEVAGQCGFDDAGHFSRRYRAYWKHPPTADRSPHP